MTMQITKSEIIEMLEVEWRDRLKAAVLAEREACAKVCVDINAKHITEFGDYFGTETYATDCAAAIRARGATE